MVSCSSGEKKKMYRPSCRLIILVLCVGFIFIQPEKVSAIRWEESKSRFERNSRVLKAMKDLHMQANTAPVSSMTFDPNQSEKRRVRRGPDPIHNKC